MKSSIKRTTGLRRTGARRSVIVLALASMALSCSAEQSPTGPPTHILHVGDSPAAPQLLTVRGRVIHPGCVHELIGSIADPLPTVAAVDVKGVEGSNAYSAKAIVEDGWVSFEDKDVLGENARFGYKLVGTMPKQIHVLKVYDSTSGSAVFMWLLLVQIERDIVWDHDRRRERLVLMSVGKIGLGDRDDGTVEIRGNQIILGKSRYRRKQRVITVGQDSKELEP